MKLANTLLLASALFAFSNGQTTVCNMCLKGTFHKSAPSAEPNLKYKCAAFKDRSCCNTTMDTEIYDRSRGASNTFNYDHCPGKNMSKACKEKFREHDCFYYCSPNLGPWIKNVSSKPTAVGVPIRPDQCTTWYNDCKDDYTCQSDWTSPWNFKTGTTTCNSTCKKFSEYYPNAKTMCETIYGKQFKVVGPGDAAMFIWFTLGSNPNDQVAKTYAKDNGMKCDANQMQLGVLTTLMTSAIASILLYM